VSNRGSITFDHTAYWTNLDEFVSAVVEAIDHYANKANDSGAAAATPRPFISEMTPLDRDAMEVAPIRRKRRVATLIWLRRTAGTATLSVTVAYPPWLRYIGVTARDALTNYSAAMGGKEIVGAQLWGVLLRPVTDLVVGILAMIAAGTVVFWVGYLGWHAWDKNEIHRFFFRYQIESERSGPVVLAIVTTLLAVGPGMTGMFIDSGLRATLWLWLALMPVVPAACTVRALVRATLFAPDVRPVPND
jgi:hypothetical protein